MHSSIMAHSITLRRFVFFSLAALTTLMAMGLLISVFQKDGITFLEALLIVLYAVLFGWTSVSFWTAALGFLICLVKRDPLAITTALAEASAAPSGDARTAILIPIYNEDTARVFAGLRAMHRSLAATGRQDEFDFFVLSDTRDPDCWVEEEIHWQTLIRELDTPSRVLYRHRTLNTDHKSGNIAEFCKRWGDDYRYMIIADADSVMSGATLVEMVRLMESHPRVGLIQVPPVPVNRESLFARLLQFAGKVYGRLFTAGLSFWQADESNYWGHNAILRTQAFKQHCQLPHLPGKAPFGGEILSHDFVEAALLRRAGWEIWLAYDLGGSYEEIPPTLIDYAKRDRRWCQGNLQHGRIMLSRHLGRLRPMSRLHLLLGVMSYLASPLWLLFLIVTGAQAYVQAQREPVYFLNDTLFPVWPVSYAVEMTTVLGVTLAFLFLPKAFALLLLLRERGTLKAYGGAWKATLSVVLETLFSTLLAPVLMLFQTKFLVAILGRRHIGWPAQQREDHATGLKEALHAHGGQTLLGLAVGILAYWHVPAFFWWFTPVLLGMVLSIPLSMLSSRVSLGRQARSLGLFLTPEETQPPPVLELLRDYSQEGAAEPDRGQARGFSRAVLDPAVNDLHCALLPPPAQSKRRHRYHLKSLLFKFLDEGVQHLSAEEKRELLSDAQIMRRLHHLVWTVPEEDAFSPEALSAGSAPFPEVDQRTGTSQVLAIRPQPATVAVTDRAA